MLICYYMAYLDLGYVVRREKTNERQNLFFCSWKLTRRSLLEKLINNTHYLYSNRYIHLFPNIWQGIIILTFMVSKICCLSRLNSLWNILDPVRKSNAVMRMNVDSNKVICPDFSSNILYGCRDDHDELPLVYPALNLLPYQLQELPFWSLFLLRLEFIIGLIDIACLSLFFPNPDPLPPQKNWCLQLHWCETWIHNMWRRPTFLGSQESSADNLEGQRCRVI